MLDLAFSLSTVFKAERQITLYDLPNDDMEVREFQQQEFTRGVYAASVELSSECIVCVLDESEYRFTAQQCGELADNLGMLLQNYVQFHGGVRKSSHVMDFIWCKLFYQMITNRSPSPRPDLLDTHRSGPGGDAFGATGRFRYLSESGVRKASYGVFMGICDELNVPLIGIEDRVFRLGVEDATWLIEQLCVGGYILAQAQSFSATSKSA